MYFCTGHKQNSFSFKSNTDTKEISEGSNGNQCYDMK